MHGTAAYSIAIESTLALTQTAAAEIRGRAELELLTEPELSVLCFKRVGWGPATTTTGRSADMLERGFAFVTPTVHQGDRDPFLNRQPTYHPHRHQSHPGYDAVNGGEQNPSMQLIQSPSACW